jgi:hypothetical protein
VPGEIGGSETYARGLTRGLAEVGTLPYTVFAPPIARDAGADFVVVTGHLGATCAEPGHAPEEPSRGCEGRIIDVAERITERPDLMVGGHTHLRNLTEANGIPIMQALRYTIAYGVVDLERTPDGEVRTVYRAIQTPWAHEVVADSSMAALVAYWDEEVRPLTERVARRVAEGFGVPREAFALVSSHTHCGPIPADTPERLARSLRPLADFPELGAELSGSLAPRRFVLGPWRWMIVVYRFDPARDLVAVLAIVDGRTSTSPLADR